jgi:hypothetical protein
LRATSGCATGARIASTFRSEILHPGGRLPGSLATVLDEAFDESDKGVAAGVAEAGSIAATGCAGGAGVSDREARETDTSPFSAGFFPKYRCRPVDDIVDHVATDRNARAVDVPQVVAPQTYKSATRFVQTLNHTAMHADYNISQ